MATIRVSTLAKVLLLVLEISAGGSFILDDNGMLPSLCFPQDKLCTCDYTPEDTENNFTDWLSVSCSAKNLTTYPNFKKISDQVIGHYRNWDIDLSNNELTTIPSGVFSNFESANTNDTFIFLNFGRNKISFIENAAFIGVNKMGMDIYLSANRITALPLAFQLLTNLQELHIDENPISVFDSATLNSMAKTLFHLGIDYHNLVLGNKELSILNIATLFVDFPSDFRNQTFNPFLVFRNTLTHLSITITEAATLPCMLINGPYIKYFFVANALNIIANNVFDCQPSTNLKVFTLEIVACALKEFPDIFKFMPSLRALNLYHNVISSVNENFIPLHNKLEILNLSNNRLPTIPAVFSRFVYLKYLYIDNNQITVIAPEFNVLSVPSVCAEGNPWKHDGLHCNQRYGGDLYYENIDNTTIIIP